jgi:hypothetical protein
VIQENINDQALIQSLNLFSIKSRSEFSAKWERKCNIEHFL